MNVFQLSALSRVRTTSLNIDNSHWLNDIIEEDDDFLSSAPQRSRANTLDNSMSKKEAMDDFFANKRRSSTGVVYPRRPAPAAPNQTSPPRYGPTRPSPLLYPQLSSGDDTAMAMSPPRPGTISIRGDQQFTPPGGSPKSSAAVSGSSQDSGPETLNLKHRDFLPKDREGDGREDIENFADLIYKANSWIEQNPDIRVYNAETVTWSTPEKARLFTDGAVNYRCTKKTKVVQGLRLWYIGSGDKFWLNVGPKQQLGFRDYLPGKDNGISSALLQINEDMRVRPVLGKILKVETLHASQDTGPDVCVTKYNLDSNRKYYTYLRLLFVEVDGVKPIKARIGLRDFIPLVNNCSPHSVGYESFNELHGRAARWIYNENKIRVVNLQTLQVKIKKDEDQDHLQNMSTWETSSFTEHGDKKTDYLRILRVVYIRQPKSVQETLTFKLSTKTFSPKLIQPAGGEESAASTSLSEKDFEDLQSLEGRVNSWLIRSGARLLCIETISSPCMTRDERTATKDFTFYTNQRDKNVPQETWLTHFRMYLDGNYRNVPEEV